MTFRFIQFLIPILFIHFIANLTHAQIVVSSRQAVLMNGNYAISGNAFLEELSNGTTD